MDGNLFNILKDVEKLSNKDLEYLIVWIEFIQNKMKNNT